MRRTIVFALVSLLAAAPVLPCSTLVIARDGDVVFGRNYDFETGGGLVLLNQRGLMKTNYAGSKSWISKYGSVTFNQFGREYPMDGMNEAGLAIGLMWLDGTVYPAPDTRPSFSVLEWIQYQLDRYATVAEVLEHASDVRIRRGGTPLHYLIGDATGAAATIEFLNGELVVHTGATLPTANLTNDTYDSSVAYLRSRKSIPSGTGSLERFARTAMLMPKVDAKSTLSDATLSILGQVAQPGGTRWSVAYDLTHLQIAWKTSESPQRKTLRLADVDFSCTEPMLMIDANTPWAGDLTTSLQPYSPTADLDLMVKSYAETSFLRDTPRQDIEADLAHGNASLCRHPSRHYRAVSH